MRTLTSLIPAEAIQSFLDAVPVPLVWFRLDTGECERVNRRFEETFEFSLAEVASWRHWSARFTDVQQRNRVVAEWHRQTRRRKDEEAEGELRVPEMELCLAGADGQELTVLHSGVVLPELNCALAICIDITARKQHERRLEEAERAAREREVLYPLLLEQSREMIVLTNADGSRSFVSPAVEPLTGWSPEEYLLQRAEHMVHPEDLLRVQAARDRCLHGAVEEILQYRTRRKDGSYLWVEAIGSCYSDPKTGATMGYVATMRDASARQHQEELRAQREAILEQQARFDQLTGVANRHVFYSALSDEARRQSRRTQQLGLLLIDVDYFKLYNDRYGHLEGDRILRRIADLLRTSATRVADLLARFGGEEFVMLLPMTDLEGAIAIAQKTAAAIFAECIPHADSPYGAVTVSVGVAAWPENMPLDRDELLLQADKALYAAKKAGRNAVAMIQCGGAGAQPMVPSANWGTLPASLLRESIIAS